MKDKETRKEEPLRATFRSKYESIDQFLAGCKLLLVTFDIENPAIKDTILRNFISKSMTQLASVAQLHRLGHIFDCYILYRSMVERLATLYYLGRTKSFKQFDDWSFMKQYESNSNALSDKEFKDKIDKKYFTPTKADKQRYKQVKLENVKWIRPNAEDELKAENLGFLYKYGYDYASTHVHPMANDGNLEYCMITNNLSRELQAYFNVQSEIAIQNSCLIASLTVNECLNLSSFKWRKLVFNFLHSFPQIAKGETNTFEQDFQKLSLFFISEPLGDFTSEKS